jgi:hypothetical protein
MDVTFAASMLSPLALGFFGLGTGYLIHGPHELFGYPGGSERADQALGVWMPRFCRLLTGVILFVGLTRFQVFSTSPPLYMAALAFSAYGIHWFATGRNRHATTTRANAGMSVAFMVIPAMGAMVFFKVAHWPVGPLFLGLFAIYLSDLFASTGVRPGVRALGLFHLVTGAWLMYLAYAVAVDLALGYHWRV